MLKRCPCCDYVGSLAVIETRTVRDPRNRRHQVTLRRHRCPACLAMGCTRCRGEHITREELAHG